MKWPQPINTRSAHHWFPSFCNQTASGNWFYHTILSATLRISILRFYGWSLCMWRTVQGQCLPVVHAQPPYQVLAAACWREAMIAMPSMGRKSGGCLWRLRAVRLCFILFHSSLCLVTFQGSVRELSIRETFGNTFVPRRSLEFPLFDIFLGKTLTDGLWRDEFQHVLTKKS